MSHNSASNDLIVITDDVPLMAELVQYNLELTGFKNSITFNNPEICLKHIRDGLRPAVVISDFQMPEMDGIELLNSIGILLPECTGIIMSSNPRMALAQKPPYPILKKGSSDFFSSLISLICEALGTKCDHHNWRVIRS